MTTHSNGLILKQKKSNWVMFRAITLCIKSVFHVHSLDLALWHASECNLLSMTSSFYKIVQPLDS